MLHRISPTPLVELYQSEELWNPISVNGVHKTKTLYSSDAARRKLQSLFAGSDISDSRAAEEQITETGIGLEAPDTRVVYSANPSR
jgi:hypothetical protein